MITRRVHWFLLPFGQKHYTAWQGDWRRRFVALLYPLFDLGLIALVAAGFCAAFQEIALSAGAAVLGCVCFLLWWSRRMSEIVGIPVPLKSLLSLTALEAALPDPYATVYDLGQLHGWGNVIREIFQHRERLLSPKGTIPTILAEIAKSHPADVAHAVILMDHEAFIVADKDALICGLLSALPPQSNW